MPTTTWLRRAAAFLLPLFVALAAHAALPAGVTQGPTVEGVTEYRLANGLTILLYPDATKPKTTVNVTYRVGSAYENYGETGMAHLLEHLVFKGTPSRGNIMQELGRRGMSYNGSTWFGPHQLFRVVQRVRREPRLGAVDGSRPDGELLHPKERPRLRDDGRAQRVRERREQPEARALGKRCSPLHTSGTTTDKSPIGARSDIENVDIARLQAFYKLYYQPDNAVLIIAGKFDPEPTLALDRQVLRPDSEADAHAAAHLHAGAGAGRRAQRHAAPRRRLRKYVGIMYHTVRGAHPDWVATDVLGDVLTLAPSGPPVQGAGRDEEGDFRAVGRRGAGRSRHADVLRADAGRRSRSRPRVTRCSTRIADIAKDADHRGRGRARSRQGGQVLRRDHQQSAGLRRRDLGVDRARRLAPVLPPCATAIAR